MWQAHCACKRPPSPRPRPLVPARASHHYRAAPARHFQIPHGQPRCSCVSCARAQRRAARGGSSSCVAGSGPRTQAGARRARVRYSSRRRGSEGLVARPRPTRARLQAGRRSYVRIYESSRVLKRRRRRGRCLSAGGWKVCQCKAQIVEWVSSPIGSLQGYYRRLVRVGVVSVRGRLDGVVGRRQRQELGRVE